MTDNAQHRAESPDEQRQRIAGACVFKERTRRRQQQLEFAADLGASGSTISKIENGKKRVGHRKWAQLAERLDWGSFLQYVLDGDVDGARDPRLGNVDPQIRAYAVRELTELAAPTGHVA